jgi:hypothetical protein
LTEPNAERKVLSEVPAVDVAAPVAAPSGPTAPWMKHQWQRQQDDDDFESASVVRSSERVLHRHRPETCSTQLRTSATDCARPLLRLLEETFVRM